MWEPRCLTTLWAFTACNMDSFGNTKVVVLGACSWKVGFTISTRNFLLKITSTPRSHENPSRVLQSSCHSIIFVSRRVWSQYLRKELCFSKLENDNCRNTGRVFQYRDASVTRIYVILDAESGLLIGTQVLGREAQVTAVLCISATLLVSSCQHFECLRRKRVSYSLTKMFLLLQLLLLLYCNHFLLGAQSFLRSQ
jgi:hypothetical protein